MNQNQYHELTTCERLYAVVVESLRRLGGTSGLQAIYVTCEIVDPHWKSFAARFVDIRTSIRWTLQINSRTSKNFDTRKNRDTFRNPKRGVWMLRSLAEEESALQSIFG